MRRAPVVLALVLATAACGDDDAPDEGRGMRGRGAAAGAGSAAPQAPAIDDDPFRPPTDPRSGHVRPGDVPDRAGREAPTAEAEEEAPARDLSAELRQRVGDPSGCLRGFEDLPDEVSLSIRATLSLTGVITRSTVSGPVPEEARDCVNGRLASARLSGPIEGAPRTVTTTVTVRRSPVE